MKLIEFNWHPSDRQLRQFGAIGLIALPAVGWIWGASSTVVAILACIGLALSFSGLLLPQLLKPVFLALTIVATPIGIVIGELALVLIYFGVLLPIGFAFRLVKRDALQLNLDRRRTTYWETKKQPATVESYFRQS